MNTPRDWSRATIDSATLVARAREPGSEDTWRLIDGRYRPLVIAFGKHLGLDAQRAEEAAQVAMGDFALAVRGGKYDPQKGRLRDFVFGIAKKKIYDAFKRSPEVQPDSFFFVQRADDDAWERAWDREWQSATAVQCLEEARAHFSTETYLMFHLRAIEERPSKEVAEMLGKKVGAVDMATHHVRSFLKEIRIEIARVF